MAIRDTLINPISHDGAILLLRLWLGAMMIFHGYGKVMEDNTKFVAGVEEMGFPAPELFAWAAALSEFAGGILLILGLFIRPVSLLVMITMAVAAFIRHADDDFGTKEKAIGYLVLGAVLFLFGSDRFSLDRLLFRRRERADAVRST